MGLMILYVYFVGDFYSLHFPFSSPVRLVECVYTACLYFDMR